MASLWHPLSLVFSDQQLERHYSRYRSIRTFLHVDLVFACSGIFSSVVKAWAILNGWGSTRMFASVVTTILCAGAVIFALGRDHGSWFLRNRTILILLMRTVHVTVGIYSCTSQLGENAKLTPVGRVLAFALVFFYWPVGMQLTFQLHVMHHAVTLIFAFLHLHKPFCSCHLNQWSRMFQLLRFNYTSPLQQEEQCRRVVLFVFFVVGFAFPTYVSWHMELRSRMHFMTEMRIPLVGTICGAYMAFVIVPASALIYICTFFAF